MKKLLCCALSFVLLLGLSACGGTTPAETTPPAGIYTPGTYTATATGMGPVTVTVTVDANTITDVALDLPGETEAVGQAAGDTLKQQILDAQSDAIDGVSGATVTSGAVKAALTNCLAQARGEASAEKTPVTDGTYSETASGFSWAGQVTCDVTFAGNAISAIDVTEEHETYTGEWFADVLDKYIPRLIEAQSLSVDAVTGATYSSNAVKECVAQAIDAAGGNSTEWYTDVAKRTDTMVLEGYDVIVVGLGGSGVLSYCAAADAGASVFGIEAAAKLGGDSACTYGPMAVNSRYLKDLYNGGEDYINADDVYATWMNYVGSDEKADVIREAVYDSGSALDYYVDNFGFSFEGMSRMLGSFARPDWAMLWCVYTADDNNTSWNVLGPNKTYQFQRAMDTATAMNEKNGYMLELTADSLITDAEGNVTGVRCTYYDGTTYEIYGDSVILATGGYIGNDEMMTEYLGSPVNTVGVTVNNGSGIRMAQAVGGALCNIDVLPMIHITQVKNLIRNDDLTADQKAVLTALCLVSDQLSVTDEGKIWYSPDAPGAGMPDIVYAPGYQYYVLYTQDEIDAIAAEGLRGSFASATSMFMGQGGSFTVGTPIPDIYDILGVGEEYGDVIKADSIAALSDAIGCDEATLSESLGGGDTTYYAVIAAGYAYATVGGLDVDAGMHVLREDGTPIENLFAVGQDSEGVCNASGKPYTPWAGQAQSWTFVSGRIAGANAAAFGLAGS
jgi:uncharacterized protein with FMN-binding domain